MCAFHIACGEIFSTNNTECGRLLEEIKCARCSPNAQVLFHPPDAEAKVPHREPELPRLCQDFCREFYYTCRGHIPAGGPHHSGPLKATPEETPLTRCLRGEEAPGAWILFFHHGPLAAASQDEERERVGQEKARENQLEAQMK
ncbi:hypothetical protein CRUP_018370 [Coryphaenoides rupestris]|nr:hypothetical protein CRUP_018370 [Coryphaenoides rupestris]